MAADTLKHLSCLFKKCLHLGDDVAIIQRSIEELGRLEIRDLTNYFDNHDAHLAPLLFWHLRRKGLSCLLGNRLAGELEYRYHRNVARNSLLQQSLEGVIAGFSREGIEVLVLKGASAFTTDLSLFRNAFVLSDIDLLVRPSDMRRATHALVSDGYSLTHNQSLNGGLKQGFVGADGITQIDLHSSLFWTAGGEYLAYGPSDLWKGSMLGSVGGYALTILSAENQICHRLVHDSVGHGGSILASSTSRLYYLCVLVDYYRKRIDWGALLQELKGTGSDRLLVAYVYYGRRELGLVVPPELEPLHRRADLVLIDSVGRSSDRLADYCHRASLAVLTARTRKQSLKHISQLFARHSLMVPVGQRKRKHDAGRGVHHLTLVFKMTCLQLMAVLYIGASSLRHAIWEEEVHVG
jgi:hypothetical protein